MKRLSSPNMGMMWIGIFFAIVLSGGHVKADFTFGRPSNLGATVNSPRGDSDPIISPDGLELYFMSGRDGGYGGWDIYVSTRATTMDDWGIPINLGPNINGPGDEYMPRLSPSGLELYFDTNRSGGQGNYDAWVSRRATKDSAWRPAENFGPPVNTAGADGTVWITNDGLELYFSSGRPSGYSPAPIYVSTRATTEDDWGDPVKLGPPVQGPSVDFVASVSADGLALFIAEDELFGRYRAGGYGGGDIWITTRTDRFSPWGIPVNLGPIINTSFPDGSGFTSPDGSTFFFSSRRPGGDGGWDLWQAPIIPIVDFTGDYSVGIDDLIILIEHWGQNAPAYDMGPMPWGDGVVDAADLEILMSCWGQEVYDPHFLAHWKLDETEGDVAYDSAAQNDATLFGDGLWQSAGGQIGGALHLDGIDDYIETPQILNPADGVFSIFAWIKDGAPGQVILSQENGVNWLMADDETGSLRTDISNPIEKTRLGSEGGLPLISPVEITDGNWHHIGIVWGGTNRILYVDDVVVAEDTLQELAGASGALHIGVSSDLEEGSFWSGLIDDVRIYNRVVIP